jgi:hypothetical protein
LYLQVFCTPPDKVLQPDTTSCSLKFSRSDNFVDGGNSGIAINVGFWTCARRISKSGLASAFSVLEVKERQPTTHSMFNAAGFSKPENYYF